MKKSLSKDELWTLSYYRASELAGALFFGRLARRVDGPELRVFLTEHFAEEANHAWLWTDTIVRLGHFPIQILETYQSQYAVSAGLPTTMPEILMITKIFEERIYEHFTKHAKQKKSHHVVKRTLIKMLKDEDGHLGWIEKSLKSYRKEGVDVDAIEKRYRDMDKKIYKNMLKYEKKLWSFLGK